MARLRGGPFEGRSADDIIAAVESSIPMRRMGKPEEVAEVAVFLASDRSSYINGATVDVNGANWPR